VQTEIHALIERKDFTTLKSALNSMEIHDLAALLGKLEAEDLALAFRLLGRQNAADIFGDLPIERQEELISMLSSEKVASIVNDMPPDERTELLEELPGELAQRLLGSLRGDELKIARSLLAYPEDSIGRLMTPEYVAVRADWKVEQVLEHLRRVAANTETLNVIYVVNEHGKMLDELRLEQIILAELDEKVSDLMDRQTVALTASQDKETAVELFKKYDAVALPVTDGRGILVGMVTVDDVLDVAEEEGTEDFQKMAGVTPLENSYFQTSYLGMIRKRVPWLVLLLGAQTLTAVALTGFKNMVEFAVLVIFMPLINSPAGNTGSQMAGLMIRGLAVQEMTPGHWKRVLLREFVQGITLGLILAVIGYGAVTLFGRPPQIALAVALAIAVAVLFANIVGAMLPFFFKRVGLDPAVSSGPFIASLMDVSGILIYFTIATALLVAMH